MIRKYIPVIESVNERKHLRRYSILGSITDVILKTLKIKLLDNNNEYEKWTILF